jgi:hypothetical protein
MQTKLCKESTLSQYNWKVAHKKRFTQKEIPVCKSHYCAVEIFRVKNPLELTHADGDAWRGGAP